MRYVITLTFAPKNEQEAAEIRNLVPQEQAHVRQLHEQGIVEALYLGTDSRHAWLVMQSPSREQLEEALKQFPLYPYMEIEPQEIQ